MERCGTSDLGSSPPLSWHRMRGAHNPPRMLCQSPLDLVGVSPSRAGWGESGVDKHAGQFNRCSALRTTTWALSRSESGELQSDRGLWDLNHRQDESTSDLPDLSGTGRCSEGKVCDCVVTGLYFLAPSFL